MSPIENEGVAFAIGAEGPRVRITVGGGLENELEEGVLQVDDVTRVIERAAVFS